MDEKLLNNLVDLYMEASEIAIKTKRPANQWNHFFKNECRKPKYEGMRKSECMKLAAKEWKKLKEKGSISLKSKSKTSVYKKSYIKNKLKMILEEFKKPKRFKKENIKKSYKSKKEPELKIWVPTVKETEPEGPMPSNLILSPTGFENLI